MLRRGVSCVQDSVWDSVVLLHEGCHVSCVVCHVSCLYLWSVELARPTRRVALPRRVVLSPVCRRVFVFEGRVFRPIPYPSGLCAALLCPLLS